MADLKTKENDASVSKFIKGVDGDTRRKDCLALIEIMRQITKQEPKMWGPSIVGFGKYHYVYASGHEGDSCLVGFAPRKSDLTLYIMSGCSKYPDIMRALGKHKTRGSCLYIKTLDDVHLPTLKKLIRESAKYVAKKKWP